MAGPYESTIRPGYIVLRSIYVGAGAMKDRQLEPGKVTLLLEGDDSFSVEGTLNTQGLLSGMAKLYATLDLTDGTQLRFSVTEEGNVLLLEPKRGARATALQPPPDGGNHPENVFLRQNLKHVHIEPFRPENLDNWEPETETDVYLAFGVLQEYTDFQYCCGASTSLLSKLGANYDDRSKPDAILIDRATDEYLMAEWKKQSTDFKVNHAPEDVDVLVCWHDNETDRDKLPNRVLALHSVAKTAVETAMKE